jgi:hypothetical protein
MPLNSKILSKCLNFKYNITPKVVNHRPFWDLVNGCWMWSIFLYIRCIHDQKCHNFQSCTPKHVVVITSYFMNEFLELINHDSNNLESTYIWRINQPNPSLGGTIRNITLWFSLTHSIVKNHRKHFNKYFHNFFNESIY